MGIRLNFKLLYGLLFNVYSVMAKSARKPASAPAKKISSASMKISKKSKDVTTDVDKVMLTLKSLLPQQTMMSSYDIMQETINYINGLNAMLSKCDDGEDICNLQSMFAEQMSFNQQTTVF